MGGLCYSFEYSPKIQGGQGEDKEQRNAIKTSEMTEKNRQALHKITTYAKLEEGHLKSPVNSRFKNYWPLYKEPSWSIEPFLANQHTKSKTRMLLPCCRSNVQTLLCNMGSGNYLLSMTN